MYLRRKLGIKHAFKKKKGPKPTLCQQKQRRDARTMQNGGQIRWPPRRNARAISYVVGDEHNF
jgi:hypothetical protein